MSRVTRIIALLALPVTLSMLPVGVRAAPRLGLEGVPRYDNIVLIEMENRQYGQIIDADPATSPHMTALAHRYNSATRYYGITHVSEPNYVALMAGVGAGIGLEARVCPAR